MSRFREITSNTKYTSKMAFLSFVILCTGAILASIYIYFTDINQSNTIFTKYSSTVHEAIQSRMNYYNNALSQISAMLMDDRELSSKAFHDYTQNIGIKENYPGLTAMGYAQLVSVENLENFISEMREQGSPNFEVWPENLNRQVYAPVKTISPFDTILKPLQGFDLLSDESRAVPMLAAAVDGRPTLTKEIQLLTKEGIKAEGFNLFYPVYRSPLVPGRKEQRSLLKKGYVFGIFHSKTLFNTILKEQTDFSKFLSVTIFLKGSGSPSKVYDSVEPNSEHEPKFQTLKELTLANREISITYSSTPGFEEDMRSNLAWIVLALGLTFSFLLFFLARKVLRGKKELEINEKLMQKSSRANALIAKESQVLSSSLDTQTNLESLGDFYAQSFNSFCVVYFSEEGDQRIAQSSSPPKGAEETDIDDCLTYLKEIRLKEEVLEKESYIHKTDNESTVFGDSVGLPLTIRGRLYGIIVLIKSNQAGSFNDDEIKLLNQLTSLAAVSLENTLLYREAQLANRLKDEFLATVSHELRTPLNVIYGHSQLILEEKLDHDMREQIQAIYRSAKAQSVIIEDLLDISSIISGKLKFQPRPIKVMDAIETAVKSVELEAKKKNIEIFQEEPHQCIIMGVKTRLVQIFWNLLSNAIKFTPENGKIAIKSSVENQHCIIKVIDTGKGIDPDFLPHIFEKFRQEEMSSTRSMGGLGLGLSIVSHLTDLHGGQIEVESEGSNQGTVFSLSFPLASLSATATVKKEGEKIREVKEHDLHDISILAVDDEPDSLNLITRILRSHKARVITADSASEALKKMKSERPDVLISDIAMPEMDGYDLIKEIRIKEKGQGTHIPAIALTAFAQEEDKARALRSGYDKYLAKPVNKAKLIDTVERALH